MVRSRRHALLLGTALSWAGPALAGGPLPQNGHFFAGNGQISASSTQMVVDQTSARAIIDWTSFSIGAGKSVAIQNGSGATLNRVTGNDLSRIAGSLTATGTVYLVNPAGVVVAPGGKVITGGGFVASTRPIDGTSFMAGGTLSASGSSAGAVVNQGTIIAGGDVVLVGQSVTNGGGITAGGSATLAAGNKVVLQVDGSRSRIIVQGGTGDVTNSGAITAAQASLQAAGGNVYALAGNNGGLIQATGTATRNGRVMLVAGGDVTAAGSISASGTSGSGGAIKLQAGGTASVSGGLTARGATGAGGKITVAGKKVTLASTAKLDASGATQGGSVLVGVTASGGLGLAQSTSIADGAQILASGNGPASGGHIETSGQVLNLGAAIISAGQGGSWLLDPTDLTITSFAASAIAGSLNAGTNVTEQTTAGGPPGSGSGDLTVAAPISWSSGATLTLSAYNNLNIDAAIAVTGGGGVVLASNTGGGSGTLGFSNGNISFTNGGALRINGAGYTLVSSMAALVSDLSGNPWGNYALAENLDASGTLYAHAPVTGFAGQFEGLGNSISNLAISSTDANVGLVGSLVGNGTVRDLGLVGGTITGGIGGTDGALVGFMNGGTLINDHASSTVIGGSQADAGGLVGRNSGTILNSFATGPVGGDTSVSNIGGLVGLNDSGTITNSFAAGAVTGTGRVGGLVGMNGGQISSSYATGTVSGGSSTDIGGLVGDNSGSITNAYATGQVSGRSATAIGGLIGWDQGTVTDVYSTGSVVIGGGTYIGGLIGAELGTTIGGYWDEYGSGLANGVGGSTGPTPGIIGLTTPQWLTTGPVANGVFNTSIWVAGYPFPVLKALPYVVIAGTGTQVYGNTGATVTVQSILDQNGNDASAAVNTSNLVWATNSTTGNALLAEGSGAVANVGTQITYIGSGSVAFAPRVITYDVGSASAIYGNGVPGVGITLNGILASDAQNLGVTTTDTLNGTAVTLSATSGVGTYLETVGALTGAAASDYVLAPTGNVAGTITITPRPITFGVGSTNAV
jgi:filamentous hemagglutinin family protein